MALLEGTAGSSASMPNSSGLASTPASPSSPRSSGAGSAAESSSVLTSAGPVRFAGPVLIDSQRTHGSQAGPPPIAAADALDLACLRAEIKNSGPDVDDVLDILIEHAAALLDAPARLAEPVDGHLVWTRAFGDDEAELGSVVNTFDTLSGAAWRSGLVQYNTPGMSTACCGEPESAIAVPVVHAREPIGGRHASSGHEVFALVVLTADHAGWFDRADVRSMLVIASAAAERIAELHAEARYETTETTELADGIDIDESGDLSLDDGGEPDDDDAEDIDRIDASTEVDGSAEDAAGVRQPSLRLVGLPADDTNDDTNDDADDGTADDADHDVDDDVADDEDLADIGHAADVDAAEVDAELGHLADETLSTAAGFTDEPSGRRAASLGHFALIQRPEANAANGFGGWFAAHPETGEQPDQPTPVDDAEPAPVDDAEPAPVDDAEPAPVDDAGLYREADPVASAEFHHEAGLVAETEFEESAGYELYPEFARDLSPITPRKPLIVAQLMRQAGELPQTPTEDESDEAEAVAAPNGATPNLATRPAPILATRPAPRLLPIKAKRPPTPGLQAPRAPSWFEIGHVAVHSVPLPAPRKPAHQELAHPELAQEAPAHPDLAQQELAQQAPARQEPAYQEPADQEPSRHEAPREAQPVEVPLTAFFQPPVPVARAEKPEEPQEPSAPTTLDELIASRTRASTMRLAPPIPGAPSVSSRQRRPNMQPASTLPPSMPAPETMGLWQWDARTGECTWSPPVRKLIGADPDQPLSMATVREAVAPLDRERFDVAVQAITSGRGVAGAIRLNPRIDQAGDQLSDHDGDQRTAYAWSEVRRDAMGTLLGAWGGVVDLTAFDLDAAQLRHGLTAQRAAQELAGLATWQWWPQRRELVWSQEMYRLLGLSSENFTPTLESWHAFVHPDDAQRARMLDLDAAAGLLEQDQFDGKERVETFRLIGSGGEIRHVQSWAALNHDGAEPVVYGATIDVTRQVQDRVLLEHLSVTDPVTGLGNRIAYDRRIAELLARPASAVTLMLLDLDRFKVVNDSLGHQIGDRLLIEVARRLVAVVPEGSVTARMGGDEFVVVPPPGATVDDAGRLALTIVDALRAPYILPETGEMLVCPASIGIAMSARRRVTGHDLLREADIALYQAKESGRDRYVVFDEELRSRTQVRARAERRLREALQEGRLVMEYQPVIDFVNGRMAGAEGLVRLHDGGGDSGDSDDSARLIPPDLFMDIAEQTGLVVEVDCWVIEAAIAQLAQWSAHSQHGLAEAGDPGELPWLAINISARSMEHPRVVRRLIEATKRGEAGRGRLKIELTEQSFIGNLPGVEAALRQLTANGIEVGIDDFGTGYSALAYLANFDLDFMKIDRSFVASVGDNPRSDAVVTAIVDLAHAHGMKVIAEGVETSRQARRLREIGCDFAQGYHFGRPGAPSRITVR